MRATKISGDNKVNCDIKLLIRSPTLEKLTSSINCKTDEFVMSEIILGINTHQND